MLRPGTRLACCRAPSPSAPPHIHLVWRRAELGYHAPLNALFQPTDQACKHACKAHLCRRFERPRACTLSCKVHFWPVPQIRSPGSPDFDTSGPYRTTFRHKWACTLSCAMFTFGVSPDPEVSKPWNFRLISSRVSSSRVSKLLDLGNPPPLQARNPVI